MYGEKIMAHTCPDCGCQCYCNGDLDDICLDTSESVNSCKHYLQPECSMGKENADDYRDEQECTEQK